MKSIRSILSLGVIAVFVAGSVVFSSDPPKEKRKDVYIPTGIQKIVFQMYPGTQIVSSCSGSFVHDGEYEYAIALFNPRDENQLSLHAFLKDGESFKHVDVAKRRERIPISTMEGVGCESAMQIKRWNKGFAEEPVHAGGVFHTKTQLDVICWGNDAEQECYEFDPAKKKFERVGGWAN